MSVNVSNGITIYKLLSMNNDAISGITNITSSGDGSGGNITTTAGHISSTSGNIHTIHASVAYTCGTFQTRACTGKINSNSTRY